MIETCEILWSSANHGCCCLTCWPCWGWPESFCTHHMLDCMKLGRPEDPFAFIPCFDHGSNMGDFSWFVATFHRISLFILILKTPFNLLPLLIPDHNRKNSVKPTWTTLVYGSIWEHLQESSGIHGFSMFTGVFRGFFGRFVHEIVGSLVRWPWPGSSRRTGSTGKRDAGHSCEMERCAAKEGTNIPKKWM